MDPTGAIEEAVRQVREHLAEVAGVPLHNATDAGLCALTVAVEEAGRLIDTLRATTAGEIAERSRHGLGNDGLALRRGQKNPVDLIEQLTRVAPAEAARRIRVGTATRERLHFDGTPLQPPHAPLAEAMAAGQVGLDAAAVIVRCLDQAAPTAPPEHLLVAEIALVEAASHSPADEVGVQARAWREALDPDGAEPRDERIYRKRAFRLGRESHGLTPFSGVLAPTEAALLRAAFNLADKPGNSPRFLSDTDRAAGTTMTTGLDGETQITIVDQRTREQRHYDVVTGLLHAGVRSTERPTHDLRSTAQVTAIITLDDLRRGAGVGWIDGIDEPVSAQAIEELVCANGFAPILLGDHGEVLMLGRAERVFSRAQIRAMAVRDGGCVNCGAPPGWCDGHHVAEWARDDGPTDIDNGVLLCASCHRLVHQQAFALKMINGCPHLLAPPWLDPQQQWRRLRNHRVDMIGMLRKGLSAGDAGAA